MKILPLILATWSYKQSVDSRVMGSLPTLGSNRYEDGQLRLTVTPDGGLIVRGQDHSGLTVAETASIRREASGQPIDYSSQPTNEVRGSHFASFDLCHVGTDAWTALKNRLAENGIRIDDDSVAVVAAGFYAERKLQEILGHRDPAALKAEIEGDFFDPEKGSKLFDAKWIRDLNQHPEQDSVAAECYAELSKNFPAAIGAEIEETNRALEYDPNVLEVRP